MTSVVVVKSSAKNFYCTLECHTTGSDYQDFQLFLADFSELGAQMLHRCCKWEYEKNYTFPSLIQFFFI